MIIDSSILYYIHTLALYLWVSAVTITAAINQDTTKSMYGTVLPWLYSGLIINKLKQRFPETWNTAAGMIFPFTSFVISLRKATYTYASLMEKKAFTINIPSENYVKEADYFGMASGKSEDKFAKTGLTPIKSEFVNAPYISEFPINIECKIIQVTELGLHTQFIGEVMNVKIDDTIQENQPIIEQIKPLIFAPDSRNYYGIGEQVAQAFSVGKKIG